MVIVVGVYNYMNKYASMNELGDAVNTLHITLYQTLLISVQSSHSCAYCSSNLSRRLV
jgi:hypothetical protein